MEKANDGANIVFEKILFDECGAPIRDKSNGILCELINNGILCTGYLSEQLLKESGLLESCIESNSGASTSAWNSCESMSLSTSAFIPSTSSTPSTSTSTDILSTSSTPSILPFSKIWKTSKTQTAMDHEATVILLDLRRELDNDFVNKKTTKNMIWQRIADKMNNMGYFVGNGIEGREKVRQKFVNLQSSFTKYLQKIKQTGEGAVEKPPYFKELDGILGNKHKVVPPIVIDSEKIVACGSSHSDNKEAETQPEATQNNFKDCETPNRFTAIRTTVRPQKERVVDVIKDLHKDNLEQRRHEFGTIVELLREENKQRHAEMMAVIHLKKHSREKRKRESDSDD